MTRRASFLRHSQPLFLILMVVVVLAAFWLRTENLLIFPPGVSNDEGVDVLDAWHVARTGVYPLYEDLGRPEPLYVILEALATALLGPGVWTIRLMTALIGVLNIAAAYWCTTQCLRDLPPVPRRLAGVFAAIVLTTAVGHITLSRAIYRAILQPLFMFLLTGFLMRGLRTGRLRDFALCGVCTALALYSYTAAYVVPVAFVPLFLVLIIFRRKQWRIWLPGLLTVGAVFAILMLPVLVRLLNESEAVLGRASAVSGRNYGELVSQLPRILPELFSGPGDMNPQYNAGRAPLIPEFFQPLFALGLVVLAIRVRHPSSIFLGGLLLLCTVPVLLTEEIPHGLRIAGEYGVFPIVISLPLAVIILLAVRLFETRYVALAGSIVVLAVMAAQGANARAIYADYWLNAQNQKLWTIFDRQLTHNEWFFRTDRREFAEWLIAQDYPMLLPMEEVINITTHTWLLRDYPEIKTAGNDFVLPPDTYLVLPWAISHSDVMKDTRDFVLLDNGVITLLPPLSAVSQSAIIRGIEDGETISEGGGQLDFMGYVKLLPENASFQFEETLVKSGGLVFGGDAANSEIRLMDVYGTDALAGTAGQVVYTLVWSKSDRPVGHDYWSYVQLLTQDFRRVAGSADSPILRWLYPSTQWTDGDGVAVRYVLDAPELEPGAYRLVAGVYPPFGENLNAYRVFDVDGYEDAGHAPTVAWIKVPQRAMPTADEAALKPDVIVDNMFRLDAVEAKRLSDVQVQVNLYWQALADRPNIDATVFVHVLDEAGSILAQSDVRPGNGQYPTFIWDVGEVVRTEHFMNLAGSSDTLKLRLGMYFFPGPQNLPAVQDGINKPDGLVIIEALPTAR